MVRLGLKPNVYRRRPSFLLLLTQRRRGRKLTKQVGQRLADPDLRGVPIEVAALARTWAAAAASADPQISLQQFSWSLELARRGWVLQFTDEGEGARALVNDAASARATVKWAEHEAQVPALSGHQVAAAIRAEVERRPAKRRR